MYVYIDIYTYICIYTYIHTHTRNTYIRVYIHEDASIQPKRF